MIRAMREAPKDREVMVVTPQAVHRAVWDDDLRFQNWWSNTAGAAIPHEALIGWIEPDDWLAFVSKLQRDR